MLIEDVGKKCKIFFWVHGTLGNNKYFVNFAAGERPNMEIVLHAGTSGGQIEMSFVKL